ncbi:MAG: hypothetical protein PVI34_04945 [Desulfobacterales bacterium]|jgi:hypothetical protein
MKSVIGRMSPVGAIFFLQFAIPLPVLATQGHTQPEGLYAHQMAHVFFMFSMGLLMYWLRKRGLVKATGWRFIQFASFFFILWNADAFLVHFIEEQTEVLVIVRLNPWHLHIQAAEGFGWLVYVYYVAKLDHLLCVPALFFLYIGLKRLLSAGSVPAGGG